MVRCRQSRCFHSHRKPPFAVAVRNDGKLPIGLTVDQAVGRIWAKPFDLLSDDDEGAKSTFPAMAGIGSIVLKRELLKTLRNFLSIITCAAKC